MEMNAKRIILVIDDDQTVCDIISRSLTHRGYEVYTETQPQKGIEKAGEILPDLIYIGLLMNTSNGLKVSKEIHAREGLRRVPVVMIISYKGELDPKYTLAIGIVDVLVKPLMESDIISKTEAILGPEVIPPAREEVTQETSGFEDIGEAREPEEGYVFEKTGVTEEEIIMQEEYHDDIPGMTDDEVSQDQERAFGNGDELSGDERISEELPNEDGFDQPGDEITGPGDSGENNLQSVQDEARIQAEGPEIYEEAGINSFEKAVKHGPAKKIRKGAITLAIIAVIVTGAYMGLRFFSGDSERSAVPPAVLETPVEDKSVMRKAETESLPQKDNLRSVDNKAKKPASVASEKNLKKEEVISRTNVAREREKAPVPKDAPAVKETKVKGVPAKEVFSAQIGFFGNLKNAESLAEKMKQKGYPVFLKKEEKDTGEIFYRVTVGRFSSRKEAAGQAEDIFSKEGMKAVPYKE